MLYRGAQTSKLHVDNVRLEARVAELEVAARAALGEAAAWRARYDDLARRAGGAAPATPLAPADRRVRHALLGMVGFPIMEHVLSHLISAGRQVHHIITGLVGVK